MFWLQFIGIPVFKQTNKQKQTKTDKKEKTKTDTPDLFHKQKVKSH